LSFFLLRKMLKVGFNLLNIDTIFNKETFLRDRMSQILSSEIHN